MLIGGLIVAFIFVIFFTSSLLNSLVETTETYEGLRNKSSAESTARAFARLPVGIKQVALAVNSQIAPAVPIWRNWSGDISKINNYGGFNLRGYYTPWRFMEGVGAIFNIFMWSFIIAGFRRKNIRSRIFQHKEVIYLFFVALLLLLLATSDINVRRIFCVYPILF
ncbi:hypothetical protein [Niabella ginsengisoli]|uniref:Uncharacterized protein n=1 Tax=Niabella ginsengisoli TaxID=522298 RepID=A0ABS9SK37_9BACT|nr:hypothetical protein [Niabella ginsengisoli]MCH5598728.1 hypothetical protein [Niabella ginsengisoli]